jgi:hypothetical protein
MSQPSNCPYCIYQSLWKHNITRHVSTKHVVQNACLPVQNIIQDPGKSYNCSLCKRVYERKHRYDKHVSKCKGISNASECEYCHKMFANRNSKYVHLRICQRKETGA